MLMHLQVTQNEKKTRSKWIAWPVSFISWKNVDKACLNIGYLFLVGRNSRFGICIKTNPNLWSQILAHFLCEAMCSIRKHIGWTSSKTTLKVRLSPSKQNYVICFIESLLKMMEKALISFLKLFPFSRCLRVCHDVLVM